MNNGNIISLATYLLMYFCSCPFTLDSRVRIPLRRGVFVTTLCDEVCQSVVFSGYSGSSINKTDRHDITEILLKVALNTIWHNPNRK